MSVVTTLNQPPDGPDIPPMHRVVVLALDGVMAFDLGVPTQFFHGARDGADWRHYDVRVVTPDGGPVASSAGFTILPGFGPEELATADTVVVSGISIASPHLGPRLAPEVAAALARIRPGARVMSICTGAFVLAAAGLLDGRPATTHWASAERFRDH